MFMRVVQTFAAVLKGQSLHTEILRAVRVLQCLTWPDKLVIDTKELETAQSPLKHSDILQYRNA
jgi:hypothetical protein